MHNLCGFLNHTYRQVKALGITFFCYPNVGIHCLFLDLNLSNLKSNKGIAGIVKHSSNLF
jgi:hypothetical protein